jgi:V-type H+-transporting ATPase subunit G
MVAKIVSDRTKRVKDARTEAQKEIEEYRRQKEEAFKKFEAEVSFGLLQPLQSDMNQTSSALRRYTDD